MKTQNYLYILILIGLPSYTKYSLADDFDMSLLIGQSALGDISRLNHKDTIPEGKQLADIYVNNAWRGQFFINISHDGEQIDLSSKDISKLGLNLSPTLLAQTKQDAWIPINTLVDGLHAKFDLNQLRLNIAVPQVAIQKSTIGYVDPEFWQHGLPAVILAYNANYYTYKEKKDAKRNNENFFATLNSGINLGAWQFRDESSYSYYSHGQHGWKNNTRYAYRPLSSIKSGMTVGDFYSPAGLFNSIRFRGISLATEMNMLPDSSQNFVPIIRGIAQTNALVSVYQNGNLVYQENVPPGEFLFKDIQPSAGSGDLLVVIQEADGRKESFSVPYSSVPEMLKEGVLTYNALAGQAKINNTHFQPKFAQSEIHYGLNNLVTLYAGALLSNKYRSAVVGSGWNFSFGALSADISHAETDLDTGNQSGQSYRLTYSKFVTATLTNLTFATYRYSTKGYYSFIDSIYAQDNYHAWDEYRKNLNDTQNSNNNGISDLSLITFDALRGFRAKNTFTVNLNQQLGNNYGSVFVSATHRNYWNTDGTSKEYQVGYANNYRDIAYNISVSRIRNYENKEETRYYLNVSVPMSIFDKPSNISLASYFTDSQYQQTTVSMSGIAGKDNQVNYTLSGSNQSGGNNLASANIGYKHPYSTLSASYSEANDYRQGGVGARGSVVAVPYHVALSGEMGQTYTIIDAPNANNMMVNGNHTALTNKQGIVLLTNSVPYRMNTYTLSETDQSSGADVVGNMGHVTPYQGSVNVINLETDSRQTFILRASLAEGKSLPFGTEVTDRAGNDLGNVGQSGILHIRSDTLPSSLIIKLNMKDKKDCVINNPTITLDKNHNYCQ
ncbi:fimbria/pilus outer membrane usher protein [Providencia stuartii]|uniref:fimbria/pilus outer membrane usher protein n=1 Tax=Providencia stuartii TaxID=588 RepID=UPI001120136E|nr:fimbria/pilus outer membrane usher protein [Providencia stuartii]